MSKPEKKYIAVVTEDGKRDVFKRILSERDKKLLEQFAEYFEGTEIEVLFIEMDAE